jgi:hypothetical protein
LKRKYEHSEDEVNGEIFLAATAEATASCWYPVLEGSFRLVGGWPQGGRRGVGGRLDTVRSGEALRTYGMTLIVEAQPTTLQRGSAATLHALYEGDGAVWFQPPVETGNAEPVTAYLLGDLAEETLGPLQRGSGAYYLVPIQVSTS